MTKAKREQIIKNVENIDHTTYTNPCPQCGEKFDNEERRFKVLPVEVYPPAMENLPVPMCGECAEKFWKLLKKQAEERGEFLGTRCVYTSENPENL